METITRSPRTLPTTFISKEVVNQRVKNFQENKLPLLSNAIGKSDTTSAWYSLEQFETMVREMYYQNADGLRIYFGAYDSNDEDFADQLTVIFVPTFLNEATGNHRDIVVEGDEDLEKRLGLPKNLDTIALCPPMCAGGEQVYPYEEPNTP